MRQAQAFLDGEGAAWLKRNAHKLTGQDDPVLAALKTFGVEPSNVLEVGCANGWRLDLLNEKYGCNVWGIDPLPNPFHDFLVRGTATDLSEKFKPEQVDLLIYGWCLYLADPEDYFSIAKGGDHVLQNKGFLIVYDFCTDHPYKVPYKHKKGLYSHHYEFSKLWLSHPAYSLYGRTVQDETCVTILKKNMKKAFSVEK